MELREYLRIFGKHIRVFLGVVAGCLLIGLIWHASQTRSFISHLTLNVTRSGSEKTADYQYHDFYRLQADERFADTLVRWLGSPRIVLDIYHDARVDQFHGGFFSPSDVFKAERLSSQVIEVTYRTSAAEDAAAISRSLVRVLNNQADALNKDQQEEAWFTVLGSDPVVTDGRARLAFVIVVSLAVGVFVGFWAVWIRHYWK